MFKEIKRNHAVIAMSMLTVTNLFIAIAYLQSGSNDKAVDTANTIFPILNEITYEKCSTIGVSGGKGESIGFVLAKQEENNSCISGKANHFYVRCKVNSENTEYTDVRLNSYSCGSKDKVTIPYYAFGFRNSNLVGNDEIRAKDSI